MDGIEPSVDFDAEGKEIEKPFDVIVGSLDDMCMDALKSAKPSDTRLNRQNVEIIVENIERGISMTTAAMYIGISPSTLLNWFNDGKKEAECITDEEYYEADGNLEELLSLKGQLYLDITKARSKCIVEIHTSLYERSFEAGKEWIATYLLERQEPEKYNLKYKAQQEINANAHAKIVEFRFINGMESRNEEDINVIKSMMSELETQYSNSDIITDSDEDDDL